MGWAGGKSHARPHSANSVHMKRSRGEQNFGKLGAPTQDQSKLRFSVAQGLSLESKKNELTKPFRDATWNLRSLATPTLPHMIALRSLQREHCSVSIPAVYRHLTREKHTAHMEKHCGLTLQRTFCRILSSPQCPWRRCVKRCWSEEQCWSYRFWPHYVPHPFPHLSSVFSY